MRETIFMRNFPGFRHRALSGTFFVIVSLLFTAPVRAQSSQEQDRTSQSSSGAGRESTPAAQSREVNEEEKDANDAYLHSFSVTKLGAMLGMKPGPAATTFTVINFAVLVLLVGFALLKLLPSTFRKRTSLLQKHLVDARVATEEASARLTSVEARLSKLDEQIAAMHVQAETDLVVEEQRIKASGEEEKAKILAAAEQEIATATALARRDIQRYAAELAIEQAARKLVITAETDRLLVQSFTDRLTGEPGNKGGQN